MKSYEVRESNGPAFLPAQMDFKYRDLWEKQSESALTPALPQSAPPRDRSS